MGNDSTGNRETAKDITRRRALQGLGVGSAAVLGGIGLADTNLEVLGMTMSGGNDYSCPAGQVIHAKYEVPSDSEDFNFKKGRGDVLNAVDSNESLVNFTVTENRYFPTGVISAIESPS